MKADELIDKYIADLPDWRGEIVAKIRKLVLKADPEITEEWKWGTPIWSHNGNVTGVCAFKEHVGMNFFKGASLADPHKVLNGGLEAKNSRSIKIVKGEEVNEDAIVELVRSAVEKNI